MKKLKILFKSNIKSNIICFCIVGVITLTGFLLYFFLNGPQSLYGATNALLIPLGISFACLGLYLVSYFGMFDTISYGFSSMSSMFSKSGNRKYHDLVEYRDTKYKKRKDGPAFLPSLLLLFLIYLICFIAVYIAFSSIPK